MQNRMTALVIKWKPQIVLDAEAATRRKLKADAQAQFPELSGNPAFLETAIDSLEARGIELGTEGSERLKEVLTEIRSSKEGELGGKWLYKCRYTRKSLTTSQSDIVYGTATVTLKGSVLTILSGSGPEVSFSGSFDNGRVTGKLGLFTTSTSCEGVGNKEKISVSGQGQIADGTFQANLILLR